MTDMTDVYAEAESTILPTRSGRTPRDGGRQFSSNMMEPGSPMFTGGSPRYATLNDISPTIDASIPSFGAPRDDDCMVVNEGFDACFGVSSQVPVTMAVETPTREIPVVEKPAVRLKTKSKPRAQAPAPVPMETKAPPRAEAPVAPETKAPPRVEAPVEAKGEPMDISIDGFSHRLFGTPPRPASMELVKRKLFAVNEFDEAQFHLTAQGVKVGYALEVLQRHASVQDLMATMNSDLHQTLAIMAHTLRLFGHVPESNPLLVEVEQVKKRRKVEEDERITRLVEERVAAAVKARIAAWAASL